MKLLFKILKNKVFLYMGSRYLTYGLQFITTLIIASKLGPEFFGIWSFILLIINFFNIVDFGISNSLTILLVNDKNDNAKSVKHISSSIIINFLLSFLVFLILIISKYVDINLLSKYKIEPYLISILFVIILAFFNKSFSAIYRVKNLLLEVAIYQSLIPVLLFIFIISNKNINIWHLLLPYLIGNFIIICIFIIKRKLHFTFNISFKNINTVLNKGFWLFLYNSAFYLIMYTTSFAISYYYKVSEYGLYNFANTLSHAIMLLIDAFGYIIFPKLIDRLSSKNNDYCKEIILLIRKNYVFSIYFLVFMLLPLFNVLGYIFPKYVGATRALSLCALTLLPYVNAFGLNTFLIAQGKERKLSYFSILLLLANVIFLCIFIIFFKVQYDIVILSTMITYILYTLSCAYLTKKYINEPITIISLIKLSFPISYIIPFIFAIGSVFLYYKFHYVILLFCPIILFVALNFFNIKDVFKFIIKIINNPNTVDLN